MTPKTQSVNCWRCGKPCQKSEQGTYMCDCTSTPFDHEPTGEPPHFNVLRGQRKVSLQLEDESEPKTRPLAPHSPDRTTEVDVAGEIDYMKSVEAAPQTSADIAPYCCLEGYISNGTRHTCAASQPVSGDAPLVRDWRSMGVVELAAENMQLLEYIKHWEGRALRAEGLSPLTITAKHCIITYQCRNNRGPMDAFDEAVDRCRKEYEASLPANFNDDFHLVLTVEKK